jgi:hypothetical protein
MAVGNQNAPKCEMLDRFDVMGWKYFDIGQAEM